MLTRLRVRGFKNLIDVEIRFGPLVCVAGLNGVGKSNLFDAIQFLGLLADKPIIEAARQTRGGHDIHALFTAGGSGRMELEADILIPDTGHDDFGQPAEASATFVRYCVALALEPGDAEHLGDRIRLIAEDLHYIPKSEAAERMGFGPSRAWLDSVVKRVSRKTSFIKTEGEDTENAVVRLQSDRARPDDKKRRGGGQALGFSANKLPRTVLSSAQNADETRTAVLVRKEMRNWRQLQLEPSALRTNDDYQSDERINASGKHVPATLYRLAQDPSLGGPERVYAHIANQLANLVDGVARVRVDRDSTRRTLRFMMEDEFGLELPADSLSDGTLRFVALAVLEQDPRETGVLCLEEPENGIHPQRVNAMIDLLYKIAVDTVEAVDDTNPLRQVLITTHSPLVARAMRPDDLVFAGRRSYQLNNRLVPGLELLGLTNTWRTRIPDAHHVSMGRLLEYLQGATDPDDMEIRNERVKHVYKLQLDMFATR